MSKLPTSERANKKNYWAVLVLLCCLSPFLTSFAQSSNQNWVKTKTYKEPFGFSRPSTDRATVKTDITYYDGLGRAIQQVAYRQGGEGDDLITHIEYDALGRQEKEYLPYARSSTSLDFAPNALGDINNAPEYSNTNNPYSQKEFEPSPLNRLLKQAAPGDEWDMDTEDHEVKFKYDTNTGNEVHHFTATSNGNLPALAYEGKYAANQLYKTVTYDENNENMRTKGSVAEFKDKLGRVVLKRHYTTLTGRTDGPGSAKALDTYYVYDDYGNLSVVIPPKLSEQITGSGVSTNLLNHLGYRYAYDHRNRLKIKKLPGKRAEFIGYDSLDRPISQGPVLSPFGNGELGVVHTKYDPFDRVAYTVWVAGWFGDIEGLGTGGPRSHLSETQTETNTVNGVEFGYTNNVEPKSGYHVLTVNYYDDYEYWGAPSNIPSNVGDGDSDVYYNNTKKPKGMPTGTWTRILTDENTADAKVSYTLYDEKARAVRVHTNYPQGGYTQVDTKYNFIGNPLYTKTKHRKSNSDPLQEVWDTYTYDDQERLETHTHKVNGLPEQLLSKNEYDALGQLISKKTGGTETNYFQKVDYAYNVRGWLTDINNTGNLGPSGQPTDLFAFKINYTEVGDDINGQVKPLYNGNIAETFWRTSSDNNRRKYGYSYDYTNRLLDAWYQKPGTANPINQSYDEHLTYDSNGNILTLQRNGSQETTSTPIAIDDLSYEYDDGNKLTGVFDGENNPEGFDGDGIVDGDDLYDYDDFGNLTIDVYKEITEILYNHLNLPTKVTFGTNGYIEYLYSADGVKLEKTVTEGINISTTNYTDGFQYTDGDLDFFPHAEGTVEVTQGSGISPTPSYNYVFNYTDHLGNIRLRYAKDPSDGQLKILEEKHYYPFGLEHTGYNNSQMGFGFDDSNIVLTPVNPLFGTSYKYGFNGKEEQNELGLNFLDFGARNYDPALGRWMNIDPLAEQMRRHSPYNYAFDNPIYFIDPDGMAPEGPIKDWLKALYKSISVNSVSIGASTKLKGTGKLGFSSNESKFAASVNAFNFTYNLKNDSSSFVALNAEYATVVDGNGIELKGGVAETEGMELDKAGKGEAESSFLKLEGTAHTGDKEYSAEGSLFGKKEGEEKGYVVDGSLETNEKEQDVEGVYNFSFQAVFGASITFDTNTFNEEIRKAEKENNEKKRE